MPKPIQAASYTFRKLIEGGFLYVDKTRYLYELVRYSTGIYFLSRPRRFGKSLMVSTLEEIFRGNRMLFEGLWIDESDYEWEPYPVIHIDFGLTSVTNAEETKQMIEATVNRIGQENGLTVQGHDYQLQFADLVRQLAKAHNGKVVLLIDEYDKPIVNNLSTVEEAKKIQAVLRALYGVIKALDRYWRFVFITGISKFSRVGVFSTMNNLDDLTMDFRFANALGITEHELQQYFGEYIDDFAEKKGVTSEALLEQIRHWYDGFRFTAEGESLYNPYSTIQLFVKQHFFNYWFATGTPSFLIELMHARKYDIESLESVEVSEIAFNTYELDNLAIIPMLFQTGYLTIKNFDEDEFGEIYYLSYPNYEVRYAFMTYLLNAYSGVDVALSDSHLRHLIRALQAKDLDQFFSILNVFFANIDYDLHLKNEKYYQTIFYMIFLLLGLNISAEMKTNKGRIDAVIELQDQIYVFEFKLDSSASTALKQTKDKEYADKYRQQGKPITLVGTNFDFEQRKITEWSSEETQP